MITGPDIRHAYDMIKPYVRRTPVVQVDLGSLTGSESAPSGLRVVLKLEQLQCGGFVQGTWGFREPLAAGGAELGGRRGVRG